MRTPVHGNDPGVVNHLDEKHHVAGRLEDLIVVVVEAGHHRTGQTACDAPLVGTTILGAVRTKGRN
jgi:hypothetical protein